MKLFLSIIALISVAIALYLYNEDRATVPTKKDAQACISAILEETKRTDKIFQIDTEQDMRVLLTGAFTEDRILYDQSTILFTLKDVPYTLEQHYKNAKNPQDVPKGPKYIAKCVVTKIGSAPAIILGVN